MCIAIFVEVKAFEISRIVAEINAHKMIVQLQTVIQPSRRRRVIVRVDFGVSQFRVLRQLQLTTVPNFLPNFV